MWRLVASNDAASNEVLETPLLCDALVDDAASNEALLDVGYPPLLQSPPKPALARKLNIPSPSPPKPDGEAWCPPPSLHPHSCTCTDFWEESPSSAMILAIWFDVAANPFLDGKDATASSADSTGAMWKVGGCLAAGPGVGESGERIEGRGGWVMDGLALRARRGVTPRGEAWEGGRRRGEPLRGELGCGRSAGELLAAAGAPRWCGEETDWVLFPEDDVGLRAEDGDAVLRADRVGDMEPGRLLLLAPPPLPAAAAPPAQGTGAIEAGPSLPFLSAASLLLLRSELLLPLPLLPLGDCVSAFFLLLPIPLFFLLPFPLPLSLTPMPASSLLLLPASSSLTPGMARVVPTPLHSATWSNPALPFWRPGLDARW